MGNSHRICSPGFSCLRLRAFAYLPKDRFEEDLILKGTRSNKTHQNGCHQKEDASYEA